jgi:hypothetical protein
MGEVDAFTFPAKTLRNLKTLLFSETNKEVQETHLLPGVWGCPPI